MPLLLTDRLLDVPVALFLPVLATLRDDVVEGAGDATTLRDWVPLAGLEDVLATARPEPVPAAETRPLEPRLRFLSHPPPFIRRLGVNDGLRSTYTT